MCPSLRAPFLADARAEGPSTIFTSETDIPKIIEDFSTSLDPAEKYITQERATTRRTAKSDKLSDLRRNLLSEAQKLAPFLENLGVKYQRVSEGIECPRSGTNPPEAETNTITELRKSLSNKLLLIDSERKSIQFIQFRAQTLAQRIVDLQRTRLADQLFSRNANPLSPEVWRAALEDWSQVEGVMTPKDSPPEPLSTWSKAEERIILNVLFLSVVVFFLLSWSIQHGLVRRFLREKLSETTSFTFQERVWMSAQRSGIGVLSLLPFILVASGANVFIQETHLLTEDQSTFVFMCTAAFILVALSIKLTYVILAPRWPDLRAVPFETYTATRLFRVTVLLLVISAGDFLIPFIEQVQNISIESVSLRMFVFSVAHILLLLFLTRASLWHRQDDGSLDGDAAKKTRWLRWSAASPVVLTAIAAISGYTELSHYLAIALVSHSWPCRSRSCNICGFTRGPRRLSTENRGDDPGRGRQRVRRQQHHADLLAQHSDRGVCRGSGVPGDARSVGGELGYHS